VAVDLVPPYVTLHVWGVSRRQVPAAVAAMARDRRPLQRSAGLTFGKLLGTGDGRTFDIRDADPRHWAVLACWSDERAVAAFERSRLVARWERRVDDSGPDGERLRVLMRPVSSKGSWSGREPFGDPVPHPTRGPVAALTRARLRARTAVTFWRAVPPVAERALRSPGLLLSVGVGESPVGVQGTFTLWQDEQALTDFAYRSTEHQRAIRRTREIGWYSEDLFARLEVLSAAGSVGGVDVDGVA
jgi:heme-degrading monooxygenase HmoA